MELKEVMDKLANKLVNLFKSDDFVQSLEQKDTEQVDTEQTKAESVVKDEKTTEVVADTNTDTDTNTNTTSTNPLTESDETGNSQSTLQSTSPTELTDGWLKKDGEKIDLQNIDLNKVNNAELRQVLETAQSIAIEYNSLNSKYSKQAEQLQNLTVEMDKLKAEEIDSAGGFNPVQANNEATSYVPGMDLETCIDLAIKK